MIVNILDSIGLTSVENEVSTLFIQIVCIVMGVITIWKGVEYNDTFLLLIGVCLGLWNGEGLWEDQSSQKK